MFIVLSGARQNAGDYLITARAKELLKHFCPEEEFRQYPGQKPLDEHLDEVSASRGIIILGGPGCQPDIYPGIYPLTKNLDSIKCPIYLLGSGWKGGNNSWSEIMQYVYTPSSIELLSRMSSTRPGISVRDHYTRMALLNNGISNIHMTGCPAWYDLSSIGKPYSAPDSIRNICFTPPVDLQLQQQCITIATTLHKLFPDAKKYACFHHGFEYKGLSRNENFFKNQQILGDELAALGYEVRDLSGGLNFSLYDDCDLHIGYRVHAHIYMLSKRHTSFLLYEDARGLGVNDALGLPGATAFIPRQGPNKWTRKAMKALAQNVSPRLVNPQLHDYVGALLEREIAHGYASFRAYPEIIDHYFLIMSKFIQNILANTGS